MDSKTKKQVARATLIIADILMISALLGALMLSGDLPLLTFVVFLYLATRLVIFRTLRLKGFFPYQM
ncbi:MAG: hypothetical protein JW844_00475 [Candidatus Omnitrophica bacterium]|nr:hypothetical protein [Candidatus Omnitrophota bacterium]